MIKFIKELFMKGTPFNELQFEYEVVAPNVTEKICSIVGNIPLSKQNDILYQDTRPLKTDEHKNNMDIIMGNNWKRLSAQLGIIAKDYRK